MHLHTAVAGRRGRRARVAEVVGGRTGIRHGNAVRLRVAVRPKLDVTAARRRPVYHACDVRLHGEVRHIPLENRARRQRGHAEFSTRSGEGIHRRPHILHGVIAGLEFQIIRDAGERAGRCRVVHAIRPRAERVQVSRRRQVHGIDELVARRSRANICHELRWQRGGRDGDGARCHAVRIG